MALGSAPAPRRSAGSRTPSGSGSIGKWPTASLVFPIVQGHLKSVWVRRKCAMRKQGDAAAHADIVIVGAGAAGIGAARRLAAADFSVLVLEAMARPGATPGRRRLRHSARPRLRLAALGRPQSLDAHRRASRLYRRPRTGRLGHAVPRPRLPTRRARGCQASLRGLERAVGHDAACQ